jgi:hypothetical protein
VREEAEHQQQSGDGRKESVFVGFGPRECQQRREHERLHQHFGVWNACVPNLDDADGQQRRAHGRRRPPDEPCPGEVHRKQPEDGPKADDLARTGQPIDAVGDGNPRGVQVWELPHDRRGRRIQHEEAHEAVAVIVGIVGRPEEQRSEGWRHRARRLVDPDQRSSLRNPDPLVHVDAGILAADDVFRGRHEEVDPQPTEDQAQWNERRPCGAAPWSPGEAGRGRTRGSAR